MVIGSVLMSISQLCGTFILANYANTIFRASGSTLDPNISSIIVCFMEVCGTCVAAQLIDRIGRKLLMIVSCFGCAIGLSVTGIFTYLAKNGYDVSDWHLVPIFSLSFFIFVAAIGMLPVPYVYVTEMLPQKVQSIY